MIWIHSADVFPILLTLSVIPSRKHCRLPKPSAERQTLSPVPVHERQTMSSCNHSKGICNALFFPAFPQKLIQGFPLNVTPVIVIKAYCDSFKFKYHVSHTVKLSDIVTIGYCDTLGCPNTVTISGKHCNKVHTGFRNPPIQSWPKKCVLGCMISPLRQQAELRNLGHTFLANSV